MSLSPPKTCRDRKLLSAHLVSSKPLEMINSWTLLLDSYRTLLLSFRKHLDRDIFAPAFPSTSTGKAKATIPSGFTATCWESTDYQIYLDFFSENDFFLHFKCQLLFRMNIFLSFSVFGKNPIQTVKREEFFLEMGPTFSSSSTYLKAYIKGKV